MEEGSRCGLAGERGIIPYVGPEPTSAAFAFGEHRHCRVIGVDALGVEHMAFDPLDQRHQRCRTGTDPVGERGGVQVHALVGVDRTLLGLSYRLSAT